MKLLIASIQISLVLASFILLITCKRKFTQCKEKIVIPAEGYYFRTPRKLWLFQQFGLAIFSIALLTPFLAVVIMRMDRGDPESWGNIVLAFMVAFIPFWAGLYIYICERNSYFFLSNDKIEFFCGFHEGKKKMLTFQIQEIEVIEFRPSIPKPRKILIKTTDQRTEIISIRSLSFFKGYDYLLKSLKSLFERSKDN